MKGRDEEVKGVEDDDNNNNNNNNNNNSENFIFHKREQRD